MASSKVPSNLQTHTIALDGDWLMDEFSDFFRQYTQVYSLYAVILPRENQNVAFETLLQRYPWKGGYSVVNFYNDFDRLLGRRARPRVRSIRYASPGAMEIAALAGVATAIGVLVKQFVDGATLLNNLYNDIRKGMIQRKLLSLDVKEREQKIRQKDEEFAQKSFIELAQALQLNGANTLLENAPNGVAALKVLLSFYRRLRKLSEYQGKGKATM